MKVIVCSYNFWYNWGELIIVEVVYIMETTKCVIMFFFLFLFYTGTAL